MAAHDLLGWPADSPRLELDHERFAYAGHFRTGRTGVAVSREAGETVAAAAFSPDRTDDATLRLRYVTVRDDRRGERLGPRLCAFVARRGREAGFDRTLIAVNNPFAFVALYRAGFGATGERTGVAERVLARPDPTDRDPAVFDAGLAAYGGRDLPAAAAAYVERWRGRGPPARVDGGD